MRLNNDCIRDILLYIEKNTDYENFIIEVESLKNDLNKYNENTLYYHIQMVDEANLVDEVLYGDDEPTEITKLSWEGHQYLDNIRDDKVWKALKNETSKLSSISLKLLIQIAPEIVKSLMMS